jgi:hypothetical protein
MFKAGPAFYSSDYPFHYLLVVIYLATLDSSRLRLLALEYDLHIFLSQTTFFSLHLDSLLLSCY